MRQWKKNIKRIKTKKIPTMNILVERTEIQKILDPSKEIIQMKKRISNLKILTKFL